jgi:hypothetical protein
MLKDFCLVLIELIRLLDVKEKEQYHVKQIRNKI